MVGGENVWQWLRVHGAFLSILYFSKVLPTLVNTSITVYEHLKPRLYLLSVWTGTRSICHCSCRLKTKVGKVGKRLHCGLCRVTTQLTLQRRFALATKSLWVRAKGCTPPKAPGRRGSSYHLHYKMTHVSTTALHFITF